LSRPRSRWLLVASGASFALSLAHLATVLIGLPAYRFFTGAGRIVELAERGSPLPALMTFALAVVFATFGLYGLAALGHVRLPGTRVVVIVIGCIYVLRGALVVPESMMVLHLGWPARMLAFPLVSLAVGLAYLVGTWRQWPFLEAAEQAEQTGEL
jgi:hypothetical protein